MTKQLPRSFLTLVLVAILLSGCIGGQTTTTIKPPLRVAWSLWPGWYVMPIAVEKGFFEKHGVKVEPVFFPIYSEQKAAMGSGLVDGGALVIGDFLLDTIAADSRVVMVTDNSDGADQLVAAPGITRPEDVRGKRIGVQSGTFGLLLVREMLAKHGISPSDVTILEVGAEQVPNAIPGSIDVGHTFEPFASQARAKGGNVIFSSADTPGLIVDVLAFRKNILQDRPEDVKAFIAAWFEALQYWQANPAEGNAIIAKATGLKVEEVSLEGVKMFDLAANLATFQKGSDTGSLFFAAQKDYQFMIDTGMVTTPLKLDDVLDASFLK